MRNDIKKNISILFIIGAFAAGVISCKDTTQNKRIAQPQVAESHVAKQTTRQAKENGDDRIKVEGELKAQLEAAGYLVKEPKPTTAAKENPYTNADLEGHMDGIDGTFVFLDVQRNVQLVHNPRRAGTRFSPCSTFKIPHTLIALDTGVAGGPEHPIKWDAEKYPKEPWWDTLLAQNQMYWDRDHTLSSAFSNSCVWYYRETAKKIGTGAMQSYLNDFEYGNKDPSSPSDHFWLDGGSLKISAKEQIQFLKRLVQNDLKLKPSTVEQGKKVFKRAKSESGVLYAKTGGGGGIGWFVGFIEQKEQQYVFAFNMAGSFEETFHRRVTVTMNILAELGVWTP